MTDDGDLPISFYRERHASKNRAGNFLAVTTLGTVLLLPPLQDLYRREHCAALLLLSGNFAACYCPHAIPKFIGMSAYVEYGQFHAFHETDQVVPYDYPNATGAGKVWAVHIVRRPGTSGACTLDPRARPARSWFIIEQLAGGCCSWA